MFNFSYIPNGAVHMVAPTSKIANRQNYSSKGETFLPKAVLKKTQFQQLGHKLWLQ